MESKTLLSIKNLQKIFLGGQRANMVLKDVSFDVAAGEFISIYGPNGCGKSTILNLIGGIDTEYTGSILLDNAKPSTAETGFVFQNFDDSLFPWMNLLENVSFGLKMMRVEKYERHEKGMEALSRMGLADYASYYPYQVSGGMKQKVCIARALAKNCKLLLLDEPFSALDRNTTIALVQELANTLGNNAMTTIMVSHDLDEAILLSSRIVLFRQSPATVLKIIDVDLEYPRSPSLLVSKKFGEIRSEIISLGQKEGVFLR